MIRGLFKSPFTMASLFDNDTSFSKKATQEAIVVVDRTYQILRKEINFSSNNDFDVRFVDKLKEVTKSVINSQEGAARYFAKIDRNAKEIIGEFNPIIEAQNHLVEKEILPLIEEYSIEMNKILSQYK